MAKKKTPDTKKVKMLRTVPAVMLQADGETPDYQGANVTTGSTRTVATAVADRLVKAGHAEEA